MSLDGLLGKDISFAANVVKRRHLATFLVHGLLGATLAGCAHSPGLFGLSPDSAPDVKAEAVTERAEARWQALIKGDLPAAYSYLSPGSRQAVSLETYKRKHRVGFYRAVKIRTASCQAEVCTVQLSLTYDTKDIKGVVTPITEKWLIEQGQVWFVELP